MNTTYFPYFSDIADFIDQLETKQPTVPGIKCGESFQEIVRTEVT